MHPEEPRRDRLVAARAVERAQDQEPLHLVARLAQIELIIGHVLPGGEGHVERLALKACAEGSVVVEHADALFVFIGTKPLSDWLPAGVLKDAKGFVVTGRDLVAHEAYAKTWKEKREPWSLETSVPGVFAAGDIRAGAMNRVASAVGEGAMVVRFVHEYLALA